MEKTFRYCQISPENSPECVQRSDIATLWRRIRATEFEIEPLGAPKESKSEDDGAVIAIDATGMRGREGWTKVHISIEVKKSTYWVLR